MLRKISTPFRRHSWLKSRAGAALNGRKAAKEISDIESIEF